MRFSRLPPKDDIVSIQQALGHRVITILAATVPLAAAVAACGGSATDVAGDGGDACQGVCCSGPPPPTPYSVTYVECAASAPDAGDDAADASDLDASDDGSVADASDDAQDAAALPPACYATCEQACIAHLQAGGYGHCVDAIDGDGGATIAHCELWHTCGRRFDGLVEPGTGPRGDVLGAVLARAAWLEAASVRAFRRLARELRVHGAPASLVQAARESARDEARHARTMTRLARAHGATVPRVEGEEPTARELEAVARENAVEGCVGETYGALLAAFAAEQAADPAIREAMRGIAPDELRHASLAWAVAAWAEPRLSPDARARVEGARAAAVQRMMDEAVDPHPTVARAAGVPDASLATHMVEAMFQAA